MELYIRELWFVGFWFFGTLVYWFIGTLDFWFIGSFQSLIFGTLVYWCFGFLELWIFGILDFGLQCIDNNPIIQSSKTPKTKVPKNQKTKKLKFETLFVGVLDTLGGKNR